MKRILLAVLLWAPSSHATVEVPTDIYNIIVGMKDEIEAREADIGLGSLKGIYYLETLPVGVISVCDVDEGVLAFNPNVADYQPETKLMVVRQELLHCLSLLKHKASLLTQGKKGVTYAP